MFRTKLPRNCILFIFIILRQKWIKIQNIFYTYPIKEVLCEEYFNENELANRKTEEFSVN